MAIQKRGGSGGVYDGTFSHTRRKGDGVTATRLKAAGIAAFGEDGLESARACLENLESRL